jgi:hypothetical protein
MKLFGLIKILVYLNITYSKVREGKHFLDMFPVQNGLKQGDFYATVFLLCCRLCHYESPAKPVGAEIKWETSAADLC